MSFIDNPQRLKPEDFPSEQQELIARIGEIYNYFVENTTNVVNGRLDYNNLQVKSLITITMTVDSSGVPIGDNKFSTDTALKGTTVVNAQNTTNSVIYPTGMPFITYTASGTGIYTIKNITNLPANNKFLLTVELTF